MDANTIKKLLRHREGATLEVKKAQGGLPGSLWETYSSFANTDGGLILLGVEERRDGALAAVGARDPQQMVKDIWNGINNRQKVSVNLLRDKDVAVVPVGEAQVVAVNVPRAERTLRPVYVGPNPMSGSFRRNGEGDYRCTAEEVGAMLRDASVKSMDQKVLVGRALDSFAPETVRRYRNRFNGAHPSHVWSQLDDEVFLFKIGAVAHSPDRGGLFPTAAGLLMFGYENEIAQEFPQYFLDYQERRSSETRWANRIVSSSGEWSGNLFDFFFSVAAELSVSLPKPFRLSGMMRVDDTPVHVVVREALLNALVNADYYGPRGVVVVKSRQGFSFSNPGDFRVPIVEAVNGGVSDPRNGTILKMFALLNMGERAGSGLPAVFARWEEAYGERPALSERRAPDRTTLSMHCRDIGEQLATAWEAWADDKISDQADDQADDKADGKADGKADDKSSTSPKGQEKKSRILAFLRLKGQASVAQIATELKLSPSQVKRYLYQLMESSKVVAQGSNRNRTYTIVEGL